MYRNQLTEIDQALWDIKGKVLRPRTHALFGWACAPEDAGYSWIGGDRPQALIEGAREAAARSAPSRCWRLKSCSISIAMPS